LAEVFYGCRWYLKIAVALRADDDERRAIARFQVVDYGSIAECLLLECCRHGLHHGLFKNNFHKHSDPPKCKQAINWQPSRIDDVLDRRSFHWLIEVSFDERLIDFSLHQRLHTLRNLRNTVHIAEKAKVKTRSKSFQLRIAKKAYRAVIETINQTRNWIAANP
jgi:hypothetical protein